MSYSYYPKRPVKSFQDLEVYQKALAICVAVVKRVAIKTPRGWAKYSPEVKGIIDKLHQIVLDLPIKIATAHSVRFADPEKGLALLEEAMLGCNLTVVYLELYRDLYNQTIENEFFEEQVKSLLTARFKIMHLQSSWRKFIKKGNQV